MGVKWNRGRETAWDYTRLQHGIFRVTTQKKYGIMKAVILPEKREALRLYAKYVKRWLDALLALAALVVLSPVMALTALWVKLDSPGPVIFRQKRVGKDKKYFQMYKFRTMVVSAPSETPTHQMAGATRYITRSGKFLRKSSLDELPQLLNIVKGDMSIVGPRPALWNQFDLVAERDQYGANALRPGLTGPAQVSGRDELPIPQKARLDGEYAQKITLAGDARWVLKTVGAVLRHEGVVEGGTGKK